MGKIPSHYRVAAGATASIRHLKTSQIERQEHQVQECQSALHRRRVAHCPRHGGEP